MGCDIHAHMEIKWDGEWLYYAPVNIRRNYPLFARMARMGRCYNIRPIAENRGLPEDVSKMALIHSDNWEQDGHSHSWLSLEELCTLFNEFTVIWGNFHDTRFDFLDEFPDLYLFGNSWRGLFKYPQDYPDKVEDARMVFWFDN